MVLPDIGYTVESVIKTKSVRVIWHEFGDSLR